MAGDIIPKPEEPPGGRSSSHDEIRAYITTLEEQQNYNKLRSLFYWNLAGEFAAIIGSMAAGAASTAYFLMLREDPLWLEGDFVAPVLIWGIVSAASWYMYRLDVVESFLIDRCTEKKKKDSSCDICIPAIMIAVLFIVSMDLALNSYGVFEVLEGNEHIQIAAVSLVCFSALLAESAQQYKYIKEIFDWQKLKAMIMPPDASRSFYLYSACSFFAMIFYSMTVFELLEVMGDPAAIAIVSLYVFLSMPYYCGKAADQVQSDKKSTKLIFTGFNAARVGNMLGDIGFSLYGYFETIHALDMVEHPLEVFDENNLPKTAGLLLLGFIVVAATCVSSFTLTAEGNNDGHFNTLKSYRCGKP